MRDHGKVQCLVWGSKFWGLWFSGLCPGFNGWFVILQLICTA